MSVAIATRLRALSRQAGKVAERAGNPDDKRTLAEIAADLVRIAEQLERDARD